MFVRENDPVLKMYSIIKNCSHDFIDLNRNYRICKRCPLIVEK